MYTESLNENYIFCVRSNIQIDNKSKQTIPCVMLLVPRSRIHKQQREGRPRRREPFDGMAALVKSQRESYIVLPEGLYLGKTRRFVQMKCLVHQLCQRRKWLGFEMKSLMYFAHWGSSCSITERRKFSQSESASISVYWRMLHSANWHQAAVTYFCVFVFVSSYFPIVLSALSHGAGVCLSWCTICY